MEVLNKVLVFLKTLPGKIVMWGLIGVTIIFIILQVLAKSTMLKAKDMNLTALINDAINSFKVKQRQEEIKDLDKPVKKEDLKTKPDDVEEFYKNRK